LWDSKEAIKDGEEQRNSTICTYSIPIDKYVGLGKVVSSSGWVDLYRLDRSRTIGPTVDKADQLRGDNHVFVITHPLKFVMEGEKLPFASATAGVELSIVWAMFTLPQGLALEGL
jgi:hypothetical protein